jgi:MFS family permease
MSLSSLRVLTAAAGAAQMADQLVLAALPLTAVLMLDAGPDLVGLLVAAHAAAWLAVSLPAGAVVDRSDRRRVLIVAQLLAAIAFTAAGGALLAGTLAGLAAAVFAGAIGIVLFVLTTNAIMPALVARAALAPANARLELARAVAAIAAPAIVGLLAQHHIGVWAYGLAAGCALASALLLARLPDVPRSTTAQGRGSLLAAIRAGAAFVLGHPVLRAIALCAVFWNFAFFVLAASFIPFALGRLGMDAAAAGITQAAYGAGALLAGATGGWIVANRPTNWTLLFGPAVSVAAGILILAGLLVRDTTLPGTAVPVATLPAAAGYFLIGFGPVLWLICQTTVRQLLTPADMLGRVTATIQTAIYGVRPLGALAGGWIAAKFGLDTAILLATLAFTASLAVVLLSPLAALVRLPVPAE